MRRLLACSIALAIYPIYAFACWTWLGYAQPRHTLGEACWPSGFTSDGQYAVTYKRWSGRSASGGLGEEATGPIQLWDLRTGTIAASFLDEQSHVEFHAEVSPDGRWIAVQEGESSKNGKIHVFDVAGGQEHAVFDLPPDSEHAWSMFRFSPDGEFFAAYTGMLGGEQVTVWSLAPKREPLILPGAGLPRAFAPDGKQLLVIAPKSTQADPGKGELSLRELVRGEERGRFQARVGAIYGQAAFSPDGRILWADCTDIAGYCHTSGWDVVTQQELFWIERSCLPRFAPDGTSLILDRPDGHVLLDAASGEERAFVSARGGDSIIPIAVSPGLRSPLVLHQHRADPITNPILTWLGIKSASHRAETTEVYNAQSGRMLAAVSHEHGAFPFLTPDPSTLLILAGRGSNQQDILEVWDLPPYRPLQYVAYILIASPAAFAAGFWLWLSRRNRKSKSRYGHGGTPCDDMIPSAPPPSAPA